MGSLNYWWCFCCSGFINNTCLKCYFLYISLGTTKEYSCLSLKRTDSWEKVNEMFIHAVFMPKLLKLQIGTILYNHSKQSLLFLEWNEAMDVTEQGVGEGGGSLK